MLRAPFQFISNITNKRPETKVKFTNLKIFDKNDKVFYKGYNKPKVRS